MSKEFRKPNVLIVGSGRSGTSTVARICHEKLGICMGHYLKPGDYMNPSGYYEDYVSHGLVRAMADGSYSAGVYLEIMNGFHANCLSWGAKDPWFLYCPEKTIREITPKLCIVTTRDIESTVKSWLKKWYNKHPDKEPPQEIIDHYTNLSETRQNAALEIHKLWPNTITLDFTNRMEEDEIITKIRTGLTFSSYNVVQGGQDSGVSVDSAANV